ncbi:MAG: methionyl-tRNA formyltransferase, partial [Shimia sp.]
GPVLLREATQIGAEETTGDLHDRLSSLGARLIVEALAAPDHVPTPQPVEGVTYAHKIDKAEARIDWTSPAAEVDRLIRGLSPFPGAWTTAGGVRLKLLGSRVVAGAGEPGEVLPGARIACGVGAVEITRAQREGKRAAAGAEVLRGAWMPTLLGDAG